VTAFTFRDPAFVSGRSAALLYPGYVQDYLDRVIAVDVAAGNTQGLELAVTDAISTCLQALVADGILGVSGGVLAQAASLIKAGCFMMGARTLSGALVPIAADMPAPTNFNFVAGDYNRRTGLIGNGSTKYLNSNRNNNADPQDSQHMACWVSQASSIGTFPQYMGAGDTASGTNNLGVGISAGFFYVRNRNGTADSIAAAASATNFVGTNRASSADYQLRLNNANTTFTRVSQVPFNNTIRVFAGVNNTGGAGFYSNSRLAFYSIGSALDLAILDARITALSNAIQAAIP
jgi:hypothetical protein